MNAVDLAALLRGHATRQSVPGAAVGVLCDGALTTAFHGIADVRTGEPVTAETRLITFGEFDADGRPRVIYDMLWAFPRSDG